MRLQNTDVRDCLIDPNNILDDNPDNRDACLTIDPDGGILEANKSASQLFGLGSLDHSPNILDYFHPGAVFHARKNLARVAQGEPLTFTLVLKEPNGTFRPYEVICHPVLKNATYCSTLLIFHPTSLQVLGEELNDARLRADLILCAPDVASWERHLQTNEFTSHNLDTLLGRVPPHSIHSYEDFCKTIHEQDILRYMETCQQAMDTHTVGSVDYRVCLDSGQIKWFCDRFRVLKDADGHAVKLIGITRDMTLLQDNLSNEAQYCPLTGLPNRNLFRQRLEQAIKRSSRTGLPGAALFIDLDKFKEINDSLGHETGDHILVAVANRLSGCLRETDTVARLGGDEFTIMVEDLRQIDQAELVAQKILDAFTTPFVCDGKEFFLTVSIGVSLFPIDTEDVDDLLKKADLAMYQAKDEGRNNYQFFTPEINKRSVERITIKRQLRAALDHDELRLQYQPQVDIYTGEVVGVEALVRWCHPEEGIISPARFIPIAQETGLIVPIGEWVLEMACKQCKAWIDMGLPPIKMAVNLSPRQLKDTRFLDSIRKIIGRSGLDPHYLEFEITEGLLIENIQFGRQILGELKAMGIHLALDDFGTGYSSLSYLKDLPLDILKMDGSFVRNLTTETHNSVIARTIIALAHSLNLNVIAEGVETLEQLEHLRDHECIYVQGFIYSQPVDASIMTERLRQGPFNIIGLT